MSRQTPPSSISDYAALAATNPSFLRLLEMGRVQMDQDEEFNRGLDLAEFRQDSLYVTNRQGHLCVFVDVLEGEKSSDEGCKRSWSSFFSKDGDAPGEGTASLRDPSRRFDVLHDNEMADSSQIARRETKASSAWTAPWLGDIVCLSRVRDSVMPLFTIASDEIRLFDVGWMQRAGRCIVGRVCQFGRRKTAAGPAVRRLADSHPCLVEVPGSHASTESTLLATALSHPEIEIYRVDCSSAQSGGVAHSKVAAFGSLHSSPVLSLFAVDKWTGRIVSISVESASVLDIPKETQIAALKSDFGDIVDVGVSDSGEMLMVAGKEKVSLYDVRAEHQLLSLTGIRFRSGIEISRASMVCDAVMLAGVDGNVEMWDCRMIAQRPISSFRAHSKSIDAMTPILRGTFCALGSCDGRCSVWKVKDCHHRVFEGDIQSDRVSGLCFVGESAASTFHLSVSEEERLAWCISSETCELMAEISVVGGTLVMLAFNCFL